MKRHPVTAPYDLLTPGEVAVMFRVDAKSVTRWANAGRLRAIRTPGGHRRFLRAEVDKLLLENPPHPTCPECKGHQ